MSCNKDNLIPCERCGKTNVDFYAHLFCEDDCDWRFMHYCSAINGHIDSGRFDTKQEAIDAWNYRFKKESDE